MAGENTRWVHAWFDRVWNDRAPNALDSVHEMMSADAVMHGLGEAGRDTNGTAPFLVFAERFRGAFSDLHITIDATVEHDDMIAARWTARMTHDGNGLGIPPTGKPVEVTGMSMARLRNGQMVEGWNSWDTMSLMQQISVPAAPPPPVVLVQ